MLNKSKFIASILMISSGISIMSGCSQSNPVQPTPQPTATSPIIEPSLKPEPSPDPEPSLKPEPDPSADPAPDNSSSPITDISTEETTTLNGSIYDDTGVRIYLPKNGQST